LLLKPTFFPNRALNLYGMRGPSPYVFVMRINLSLPADLKKSMSALPVGVNWSALAAQAFRRQLDRLAEAQRSGTDWAIRVSTETELRRLQERWQSNRGEFGSCSAAEAFFFIIEPESTGRKGFAIDFWELVSGKSGLPDELYVEAFALASLACASKLFSL
jgi:hypothetical protein